MSGAPLLTLLTVTPLLAAVMVAGAGRAGGGRVARGLALASTVVSGVLAGCVWWVFDAGRGDYQLVERAVWMPGLDVYYHLGVDGLGLVMVLLVALLVPFALLVGGPVQDRGALYHALVLFLQAGLFGSFTALNFVHWFLFWELSLIPAFFLIKLWGGPGRSAAATQFFVYTMAGSVALLLGFLALRVATGSFEFPELASMGRAGGLEEAVGRVWGRGGWSGTAVMSGLFFLVLLGFAVKVPLMPFHTWLPATYAEAPTAVTMLLTGAMSKMGVYGLLRIVLPLFPGELERWSGLLLGLAVVTVVAGAAAAMAQRDLKRMLAYSSVNHLGYCQLAVFAVMAWSGEGAKVAREAALSGAVLQMFNHGVTAATLFGFVALLERRSGGLRGVDDFGGLRAVAPVFAGLMGVALFASVGLPGLSGFVGEFLVFKGVFGLAPWAAALSTLGLLFTAIFTLTLIQKVFWGPLAERWRVFPDLTVRERVVLAPVLALLLLLGVWPQALAGLFNQTLVFWVERIPS